MKRKLCLVTGMMVMLSLVLIPFLLWAEDGGQPPQGEPPQGPPPQGEPPQGEGPQGMPQELIAACEGKSVGDSCEFTMPNGDTITGTCQTSPEDESQLACKPSEPPERPQD
jgi:hypothetical protein